MSGSAYHDDAHAVGTALATARRELRKGKRHYAPTFTMS